MLFILVGLVLGNYEQHLKDQQFQHLQFTVTRVKEHQAVITKLHKQIKELSAENETTKKELVAVGVTLAASQVALKAAETKNEKQLSNQISKLDDKYKRQLQALQTHTDSLVNEKLAKQEQDFSRRLKEMTTYYNEKLSTIR